MLGADILTYEGLNGEFAALSREPRRTVASSMDTESVVRAVAIIARLGAI